MATELQYAYAAGLFDGEGTIDIDTDVRMAVKMTDEEPVRLIHETLGGHFYQWKNLPSGRQAYEWRASGWSGVMSAIDSIFDYSTGKRRQLQVAGNWYIYKSKHGPIKDAKVAASAQMRLLRRVGSRPISFDIETMGLQPSECSILSCSYQIGDEEDSVWKSWRINVDDEERMLLEIRATLEAAPWTMGFNSSRFDIPFINKRLALYSHRPMFLGSHDDVSEMYRTATKRSARTSLFDMANELGLTDVSVHKTPIDWDIWRAADSGETEAIKYVLEHGDMDVILTKRGHDAIMREKREEKCPLMKAKGD